MTWIAAFLVLFSLTALVAPLIPSNWWALNMFTYPRIQVATIQAITTVMMLMVWGWEPWTIVLTILLLSNIVLILRLILPYTAYGKKQLADLHEDDAVSEAFTLLIWNVYQHNRQYRPLLDLVEQEQPDLLLLCEPDEWWIDQLQPIRDRYPHHQEIPLDNTYGMCLYSRYSFEQIEVRELIKEEIPSIRATVQLENGQNITFFCVHPIPPYPVFSKSKAPKDAELFLVAKEVREVDLPTIVMGDLNDVAWSNITVAFQKISRLLDPRRGRGIIPTFHAKYKLLRVPIDQIFCSTDFRLISLERRPAMGSDHFPLLVKLAVCKQVAQEQQLEMSEPSKEDWEFTTEQIREGKKFAPQTGE